MILHPASATFGDTTLHNVLTVAIERLAAREIADFTDEGPHVTFADVPERKVHITLVRRPSPAELAVLQPGTVAQLAFSVAAGASDAARVSVHVAAMLREVRYDLGDGASRSSPRQSLSFIALSPDGLTDPVTVQAS